MYFGRRFICDDTCSFELVMLVIVLVIILVLTTYPDEGAFVVSFFNIFAVKNRIFED